MSQATITTDEFFDSSSFLNDMLYRDEKVRGFSTVEVATVAEIS